VKNMPAALLLLMGLVTTAFAAPTGPAPEIDPGSAANAIAVLFGAATILRGRRKS
jgi:hypothetical protein